MNREHSSGMMLALTATFLWSTTFLVGRCLFANQLIDAGSLAFYRFLIGALFTFAIAGYVKEKLLLIGTQGWKNISSVSCQPKICSKTAADTAGCCTSSVPVDVTYSPLSSRHPSGENHK